MTITKLSKQELSQHVVGEAITVSAVMAVLCAAVMLVVIYKLYLSSKGTATVPGGWKFTWN